MGSEANTRNKLISRTIQCGIIFIIVHSNSNANSNEPWLMPLTNPTITQDYDCYNCYNNKGYFHAGLDMVSSSPYVRSAQNGVIHAIYRTKDSKNAWCDGSKDRLSELSSDNKNFGNTVIIRHTEILDNYIPPNFYAYYYSQYSHLACIDKEVGESFLNSQLVKATVDKGQIIGKFGGSGSNTLNDWKPHLHFEAKLFGTLNSTGKQPFGYNTSMGYHFGYLEPMHFFHRSGSDYGLEESRQGNISNPANPEITEVNIRVGPDPYVYPDLIPNKLPIGTEVVIAGIRDTESGRWYKIELGLPNKTYSRNGNNDNNSPYGWIHSDDVILNYGLSRRTGITEQNNGITNVYDDTKKNVIAKVFVNQTFPVLEWYQDQNDPLCKNYWLKISVGVINLAPGEKVTSGWICNTNIMGFYGQ